LADLLNFFVILVSFGNDFAAFSSDFIVRVQEDYADECLHSAADAEVKVVASLYFHELF
jgi:hypothetical protein